MTEKKIALHWINGEWVDAGDHRDSVDPATMQIIGTYSSGGVETANQAIQVAKEAFRKTSWKSDRLARARVLNSMADAFERHAEHIVAAVSAEVGKVTAHARFETGIVPHTLRFNAALALTDHGRVAEIQPGSLDMVIRQAAGVAGIIAPWNSPVALSVRSLAPALAAGATVVMMLPRQTAQVNSLLAQVISETEGLPKGVVNIITGGQDVSHAIIISPDVPVISFTGSSKTGRAISADASADLKRLGLELGGKSPMLLFADADLDAAIPALVTALTVFTGQFCMTISRVLVDRKIADRVRVELAKQLDAVIVGPATDPTSQMGPIIDKPNVERIDKMVEDAIAAGAKVILRGGPIRDGALAKGAFYKPTLLEVTTSALEIVQKEVFGPVLTMQVFDTEEEAIGLANDSEFGLCASVWSRDIDRPLRVARELDSGTVWVNDWAVLYDQFEEGGFKQSGQGRMRGVAVLDDFIEYKHISMKPGTVSQQPG
jgi:betaine-aldehyde dehydrogenase